MGKNFLCKIFAVTAIAYFYKLVKVCYRQKKGTPGRNEVKSGENVINFHRKSPCGAILLV